MVSCRCDQPAAATHPPFHLTTGLLCIMQAGAATLATHAHVSPENVVLQMKMTKLTEAKGSCDRAIALGSPSTIAVPVEAGNARVLAELEAAARLLPRRRAEPESTGTGHVLAPMCVAGTVRKSVPPDESHLAYLDRYACCVVSDRLRFVFLKVAKNAGSTVLLKWLRPSLCPPHNASDAFPGYGGSTYSRSCPSSVLSPAPTLDEHGRRGSDCAPCSGIPLWKWKAYFVFAVVRNPFTRMVSSFRYCRSPLPWTDFCEAPEASGGCFFWNGSDRTLGQPPKRDIHYEAPAHWAYHGWWGWHVDYVIRMESMGEGMRGAAAEIVARASAADKPLAQLLIAKQVELGNFFASSQTPMAARAVCRWYSGANRSCHAAVERTLDPLVLCYDDPCPDERSWHGQPAPTPRSSKAAGSYGSRS